MGSSLGRTHPVHIGGFSSSTAVPADDDANEFPRPTWGARSGDCVSASGRVRDDHMLIATRTWISQGGHFKCFFCNALFGSDREPIFYERDPVVATVQQAPSTQHGQTEPAPDPIPTTVEEIIAAEEGPGEQEAPKRSRRKEAPVEEPVIECECGAVNPAAFMGNVLDKCLHCQQDLHVQDDETEPAEAIGRYQRAHSARARKKFRKAIVHRVDSKRRDGELRGA